MTGFQINPPRTALVDAEGRATPEFYRFLVQIQRIIGGPSDPFTDNYLLNDSKPQAVSVNGISADDLALFAPAIAIEREPALPPPPVHVPPVDDFLYPPRYGA